MSALASPAAPSPAPYMALGAKPPIDVRARAREQAVEFEAVFLNSMFSQMFTGIDGDGPFGSTTGTGIWRSMLTDEYAKSFAKAGGIGLSNDVFRSIIMQQAARSS